MTLAERILARAAGRDRVEPGEIVVADIDRLILHDLSGYLTAKVFGSDTKPNFTVDNVQQIQDAPTVDFGEPAAQTAPQPVTQ